MTETMWLLVAQPRRVSDGAVQTVRLAGGGTLGYKNFGTTDWWAGLDRPPAIAQKLGFSGNGFGEGAVVQASELRWRGPIARQSVLGTYYWGDASFTLYKGADGAADGALTTVLTGNIADGRPVGRGEFLLQLLDPTLVLAKPILTNSFAGTGGIEGPAELKGQPKWRAWGKCRNVTLRSLNPATNIWVATDPSFPIQAFDQVYDRGNAASSLTVVAWAGSIAATLAALEAAAAPDGGAAVAPSIACIKWWYANPGKLTADLRGEIGTGYVDRPADIAAALSAAVSGPAVDATMLTAARAARNGEAGWLVQDTNATAADQIEELLSGVSLWWALSGAGVIEMGEWAWGSPVASIKAASIERTNSFQPVSKVTMSYRSNNTVMARGDLAQVLLPGVDLPYATELYDAFNYVSAADFDAVWTKQQPVMASTAASNLGERSVVATSDIGGTAIKIGNNSGNDSFAGAHRMAMPYSPEDLHEIEFDVEFAASDAGAQFYAGILCLDANGANLSTDNGTFAYITPGAAQNASLGRRRFRAYFRGTATVGAGNGVGILLDDLTTIRALPTGTVKIAPLFLANWSSNAGQVTFHQMRLSKVDITVIPTGAWSNSRTYAVNEGVTYGGRFFASRQSTNLNHQPPATATSDSWWFLISDKGADGSNGTNGTNGTNGIDGVDGVDGASAKAVTVTATSAFFPFDAAGAAISQTVMFKAVRQNTTVQTQWTIRDRAGGSVTGNAAYIASTFPTAFTRVDDDTLTMTHTQFVAWIAGGAVRETTTVEATITDGVTVSDSVTIQKADASAVLPVLTNQADNVAADAAGNVASFAGLGGTMKLFAGGSTPITSGITFSLVSSTGVTVTINSSTGVYAPTAMSAATGTATLRATYAGKTYDLVYSISKAIAGTAGTNGTNGTNGANGAQGISSRIVFQRAATVPATPAASAGTPSGWYDTTTAVPAGSNPMWSTTGSSPLGGGNYTWGAPVRVEAISANQTGESTAAFFTASATLTFVLNPGQSRNVYIQGDIASPTGSGTIYPQIEYREAGGSWTANNGTSWAYANADPVPAMDLNHSILVSNSGTEARTYEVRGTIVRSNTNSGALTTALSFLRI